RAETPYRARLMPAFLTYEGPYDHLSRLGEWEGDASAAAEPATAASALSARPGGAGAPGVPGVPGVQGAPGVLGAPGSGSGTGEDMTDSAALRWPTEDGA
ncbi:MAG: hypothetical protein AAFR46_19630, partial [Pseudomonadota bacterium]